MTTKKPDPESRAGQIRAAYEAGLEVEEIAADLGVPARIVNRTLWVEENKKKQREYDRAYRAARYRKDPTFREEHVKRVRKSQDKRDARSRVETLQEGTL